MRVLRTLLLSALMATPVAATAIQTTPIASDQALLALLGGTGEPGVGFVAQGRIGISGPGDYELSLGADTSKQPFPTAQYAWVSGEGVKFSVGYQDGVATFVLGGQELNFKVGTDNSFTDVFIRARSSQNSQVSLTHLVLDRETVEDVSAAKGELDILQLSGLKLSDGFNLSGVATFDWSGVAPTRSNLAFQIKVAETAVPKPSAALLMVAVAGVLFGVSRTRTRTA